MNSPILPFDRFNESHANSWYRKWRAKILAWLKRNGNSEWADILLLLPDLFMFTVGVMSDSRVPHKFKLALLSAALYVLNPIDLIPEAVLGVAGLIDDAGILIILLNLLLNTLSLEPDVLEQVLQDHWHATENLPATIKKLLQKLKKMSGNLFEKLRNLGSVDILS